jgi:hypothetical protein
MLVTLVAKVKSKFVPANAVQEYGGGIGFVASHTLVALAVDVGKRSASRACRFTLSEIRAFFYRTGGCAGMRLISGFLRKEKWLCNSVVTKRCHHLVQNLFEATD